MKVDCPICNSEMTVRDTSDSLNKTVYLTAKCNCSKTIEAVGRTAPEALSDLMRQAQTSNSSPLKMTYTGRIQNAHYSYPG